MSRRWLLLAAVAGVAIAARAPAQPESDRLADEPTTALGFDHIFHDSQVSVSGFEPIPCTACHTLDKQGLIKGRPGHEACYGACHGNPPPPRTGRARGRPYPIGEARLELCRACHAGSEIAEIVAGSKRPLSVFYPPYQLERDFGISLSHARHDQPSRAVRGCATCHPIAADGGIVAGRIGQPHSRCVTCHLTPAVAEIPPISDCNACHPAAFGRAAGPHRLSGRFPVAMKFSHRDHLGRESRPPAESCRGCHVAAAETDGNEIPAPRSTECEGCHDGTTAFSTLTPACRRCHTKPAERIPRIPQPPHSFSHHDHRKQGVAATCVDCHTIDEAGVPRAASPDHRPCSDADCHRQEFSALEPTICRTCHAGNEPYRPLHTEHRPPLQTEFGSRFSHRSHLAGDQPLISAPCNSCHNHTSNSRDMRLGHDHKSCMGEACHQQSGGPAPALDDCASCHTEGLIYRKLRACAKKPWSVRARFRHAPHRIDPATGQALACSTCHESVTSSDDIDDIETPKKPLCAGCHDGNRAFKLTGHGCARCHGR